MPVIPEGEDFDEIRRKLMESLTLSLQVPEMFMGVDKAIGKDETVFLKVDKPVERERVRETHIRIEWEHNVNVPKFLLTCPDCGHPWELHDDDAGCPDIIDGQFKPDEPPLLSSGEEE